MKTQFSLTLALLSVTANAAVIASYQFDGGSATSASVDTDPDSTASPFGVGAGINGGALRYSTFAYTTGNRSASMLGNETDGSDQATTVSANDYWTFTVTAVAGVLDLDRLTFNYGGSNGITSNIFVRSSVSDFATTIATIGPYTSNPGGGTPGFTTGSNPDLNLASIDLTSLPGYQDLTTITFRIYGYDSTSDGGTAGVRIDNLILTTVPEPSSALLAFSLIPFALLHRKRNS